jgi:ABC-type uncharacterized transport system fused permease/ATPase subunit
MTDAPPFAPAPRTTSLWQDWKTAVVLLYRYQPKGSKYQIAAQLLLGMGNTATGVGTVRTNEHFTKAFLELHDTAATNYYLRVQWPVLIGLGYAAQVLGSFLNKDFAVQWRQIADMDFDMRMSACDAGQKEVLASNNAAQRRQEDLKLLSQSAFEFALIAAQSLINAAAFIGIMAATNMTLAPLAFFPFLAFLPPVVALIGVAAAYGAGLTFLVFLTARSLQRLTQKSQRLEADHRQRIERQLTESTHETPEDRQRYFLELSRNQRKINVGIAILTPISAALEWFDLFIPYMILAPIWISNGHPADEIGPMFALANSWREVARAFTIGATKFPSIAEFLAAAVRVDQLDKMLDGFGQPSRLMRKHQLAGAQPA